MGKGVYETKRDPVALGLDILQRLLVGARFLAGERAKPALLYDVLDRIELLPTLLNNFDAENVRLFRELVRDLKTKHKVFADAAARVEQLVIEGSG